MPFEVVQVPVWTDNYAYLLIAQDGSSGLVDSPEAGPILEILDQRSLRLTHIFNTHHHPDHIGANSELARRFPGLEIWGGLYDSEHGRIPGQTRALLHDETFHWGGSRCRVLEVPGHTLGHIAYAWDHGAVFVGDTLFVGGCGRLFEGTPEMMERTLYGILGELPDDSLLYCGHEYTEANLRFARSVDGDNPELLEFSLEVERAREEGHPTVPSRLHTEWAVNPFMRCDSEAIRRATGSSSEVPRHEVFGILRAMKDRFRG